MLDVIELFFKLAASCLVNLLRMHILGFLAFLVKSYDFLWLIDHDHRAVIKHELNEPIGQKKEPAFGFATPFFQEDLLVAG